MYQLPQFSISSNMPIKEMAFYNEVFGWTFQLQGKHTYLSATEEARPCQIIPLQQEEDSAIGTIAVKDVDRFVQKVLQVGGEIVIPKTAVPGIGWMVYCKGPEQPIFSLMQADQQAA